MLNSFTRVVLLSESPTTTTTTTTTTHVPLHLKPSRACKTQPNNSKQNKAIQYYKVQSFKPSQYRVVQPPCFDYFDYPSSKEN